MGEETSQTCAVAREVAETSRSQDNRYSAEQDLPAEPCDAAGELALPPAAATAVLAQSAADPNSRQTAAGSDSGAVVVLLKEMEGRILDAFEQKLAFDAVKEKQLDRLHDELQGYRADLVARAVRPVFQSLIRLHDDLSKVLEALDREDRANLSPDRLLDLLRGFRDDVELALNHNGVESYREDVQIFDPRRQRALRTVRTTDQTQVGTIAAQVRPGFQLGETILEKERVAVYAMSQSDAAKEGH